MGDPQLCPGQGATCNRLQFFESFDVAPGFNQTSHAQRRLADQFFELRNA
jgi:hypothetical protein